MRRASTGDWLIIIFIVAALGGGGGLKGCENSGSPGNNKPNPQHSAPCNEYFKGGC